MNSYKINKRLVARNSILAVFDSSPSSLVIVLLGRLPRLPRFKLDLTVLRKPKPCASWEISADVFKS